MAIIKSHWRSTAVSLLLLLSLSATAKAEPPATCQSPWLPLDVGNYWVYRFDSRILTGSHLTVRVLGPYELGGLIWCQIESPFTNYFLRVDDRGRILRRYLDSSVETVFLDPTGLQSSEVASPLGFTAPSLNYLTADLFTRTSSSFARGIGLASKISTITTGSSGGFSEGQNLIEASIAGRIYRLPSITRPSVQLELGREFRNCALPCYYAACGLGTPVDPPNTNKPCLEARLETASLDPGSSLLVTISDSDGKPRFAKQIPIEPKLPVLFESLPFYNQQFTGGSVTLFPAAEYLVSLTALSSDGKIVVTTTQRATYP